MHFLTREELYRFGMDKREHVETAWSLPTPSQPFLRKLARSKASDSPSFRTIEVQLSCLSDDRTLLLFLRDAEKGDTGAASASLTAGSDKSVTLTKNAEWDPLLAWSAVLSSDEIKDVWATPKLQVSEFALPENKGTETKFVLDTLGLEDAWRKMSAICQSPEANATPK
jgi:hypothetical protein